MWACNNKSKYEIHELYSLYTFVLVQGEVNRNFQLEVLNGMGPGRTSRAWYFHSPVYHNSTPHHLLHRRGSFTRGPRFIELSISIIISLNIVWCHLRLEAVSVSQEDLIHRTESTFFHIFTDPTLCCLPIGAYWCLKNQGFFHHFGTMTHTPGIGNFSVKMPKMGNFQSF